MSIANGKFKITLREALLSVFFLAIMVGLGVLISGSIRDSVQKKYKVVMSSVQIDTPDEFDYCLRTDVGNYMADGELIAIDSVSIPDISGWYMKISKVKERYTRHVRTYTTTDGKGHTRVHHQVYYSWDPIHTDEFHADSLKFLEQLTVGVNIPRTDYNTTIKESSTIRYVYRTTPTHVSGLMMGTIDNHTATFDFDRGNNVDNKVFKTKAHIKTPITIFWIFWILSTIILLGLFYWEEWGWLERN